MNWLAAFAKAHPKAIDFPRHEYEADKEAADDAAAQHGYRLRGIRLARAVFTAKTLPPAPDARIPSKEDGA